MTAASTDPERLAGLAGRCEEWPWVSRRDPTLEERIVFEDAESVEFRFRRVGLDGAGVYVGWSKDLFETGYRLKAGDQ